MNRIGIKKLRETEYLVCVDNDDQVFVFDIDALCLDKPASFRPILILRYAAGDVQQ